MRILILFLFFCTTLRAQPESYYSDLIAEKLGGVREYRVENGRVDILTSDYAIEVKRADDWKHTIGQALWYALQTNKQPGIILIMKSQRDRKYGIQLQTTLNHSNLNHVKVWFYPEDFGGTLSNQNTVEANYRSSLISNSGGNCMYWINTGSKKKTRHNQSCRYYNNTKRGRCTDAQEGNACGQCGG